MKKGPKVFLIVAGALFALTILIVIISTAGKDASGVATEEMNPEERMAA